MTKHVHSTDPRKPAIVAALKRASGGTKVTQIREHRDGTFTGACMASGAPGIGRRGFERIGVFTVRADGSAVAREPDEPEPEPAAKLWLHVNGARLYLDRAAFKRGEVRAAPGTLTDQCQGCGQEIVETGKLTPGAGAVRCATCGERYDVQEA